MNTLAQPFVSLPEGYPDSTRVWIYQTNVALSPEQSEAIIERLSAFCSQWKAHNLQLRATGRVYMNRFICLFADESQAGASGCSIDTSVRFIQQLEKDYSLVLTDRMSMAYLDDTRVKTLPLQSLKSALSNGLIHSDVMVFDNLVANLGDMQQKWIIALKDSWFMRFAT